MSYTVPIVEYIDDYLRWCYKNWWKNFIADTDPVYLGEKLWNYDKILKEEYNAKIKNNELIFQSEQDYIQFLLRWG